MPLLGTMFTITNYGTWLRGDKRGWVDDGKTLPADPELERADEARLKHPPFLFCPPDFQRIGVCIGESLRMRLEQRVWALAVNTWHVHFVVAASRYGPAEVVPCTKDAVRYGLRAGRPIWTAGYDKRFCFDERTLRTRIAYVERHNLALGWAARPWEFIEEV